MADILKSAKDNPLQTALAALILASLGGGSGALTSLFTPDRQELEHSSLEREVSHLHEEVDALQSEMKILKIKLEIFRTGNIDFMASAPAAEFSFEIDADPPEAPIE